MGQMLGRIHKVSFQKRNSKKKSKDFILKIKNINKI